MELCRFKRRIHRFLFRNKTRDSYFRILFGKHVECANRPIRHLDRIRIRRYRFLYLFMERHLAPFRYGKSENRFVHYDGNKNRFRYRYVRKYVADRELFQFRLGHLDASASHERLVFRHALQLLYRNLRKPC